MEETRLLCARFEDYHAFENALRALKEAGVPRYDAYGPVSLSEVRDLMPPLERRWWDPGALFRNVRFWATLGAIFGLAAFFYMCVRSSLIYDLITGGKPPVSRVPFIIVAYEGTILFGAIAAFIAAVALARLGLYRPPHEYDPRFSGDSFGVTLRCRPEEKERLTAMLQQAGAVEVE